MKVDFDDILIQPKAKTDILSRYSEIWPYYDEHNSEQHLPIMSAPMSSVVNGDNVFDYIDNNIFVVLPRTHDHTTFPQSNVFYSVSLSSFKDMTINHCYEFLYRNKILIDIANGHIVDEILNAVRQAKNKCPELTVMVGNVANPETFKEYVESSLIDYVRVGIGNGNGCLTTQQTGVGYPMASLIKECYDIKTEFNSNCKIVADGGMKQYSDIIKALGLGADYVMVGSLFNKSLESAGKNYFWKFPISDSTAKILFKWKLPITKKFYGMSTKLAQTEMGNKTMKTSEGVVRYQKVEYKLEGWKSNLLSYLMSAMSYSNARNLKEFIGKIDYITISDNALRRFKK